jgi:RND family efflux transporter MFP subunit
LSASLANINAARAARNSAQSELRAREAERISAVADVELQNSEFERTRVLVAEGVQARQQLDQAVRNRNAAIAALNSAIEQVGAARANVDEANAALAQAQAEAEAVREDLEQTLVTAPIAGVVGDIPIKLGDYVSLGDTLTTITQNQTLELELSIPLEQRDALRIGLPVQIVRLQGDSSASSSPANQAAGASAVDRPTATGRISFISPQANANSQSVLVKASFANPDGLLQDEQRVDAKVIWRERPGILVPVNAISRLGGETFVYVAETQQNPEQGGQTIARQKRVQLGSIQGNSYQVLEGLEAGEQIVVSGLLNLSDGVPIMPESQNPAGQAPQPAE